MWLSPEPKLSHFFLWHCFRSRIFVSAAHKAKRRRGRLCYQLLSYCYSQYTLALSTHGWVNLNTNRVCVSWISISVIEILLSGLEHRSTTPLGWEMHYFCFSHRTEVIWKLLTIKMKTLKKWLTALFVFIV